MKINPAKDWSLIIGIIAMILLVAGTLSEPGSLTQKLFFVIGAPALGVTAYANKQKMFTALQSVATIGAVLAFSPTLPQAVNYLILLGAGLFGLAYLFKTGYYKNDKFGWIGSIGLLNIAAGYATNAILHLMWFSILLGMGGLIVALYSTLNFFHYKVRVAILWIILNIAFSINPLLNLIK